MAEEKSNYQKRSCFCLVAFDFPSRILELRTYAKWWLGISMIPAIKKLYKTKEDRSAALKRHLEFFNTHPYVASPILGLL